MVNALGTPVLIYLAGTRPFFINWEEADERVWKILQASAAMPSGSPDLEESHSILTYGGRWERT